MSDDFDWSRRGTDPLSGGLVSSSDEDPLRHPLSSASAAVRSVANPRQNSDDDDDDWDVGVRAAARPGGISTGLFAADERDTSVAVSESDFDHTAKESVEDRREEAKQDDRYPILRHLILSSPEGELEHVIQDFRVLIEDDSFLDAALHSILVDFRCEHLTICTLSSGSKIVLSNFNRVGVDEFLDFQSKTVVRVNPFTGEVVSERIMSESEMLPASLEQKRAALHAEISSYVSGNFPRGAFSISSDSSSPDKLVVSISCLNTNFASFYTGKWRSVWKVGDASVSGYVKAQAHYYEDGNVQLNSRKQFEVQINGEFSSSVRKIIEKSETDFQSELDESVGQNLKETFKTLRRRLPVRGNKFEFADPGHSMVRELGGFGRR